MFPGKGRISLIVESFTIRKMYRVSLENQWGKTGKSGRKFSVGNPPDLFLQSHSCCDPEQVDLLPAIFGRYSQHNQV